MVLTQQPGTAGMTHNTQIIPTGVDTGAGLVKISLGSGGQQMRIRTPAKVLEIKGKLPDVLSHKNGGHFFYHEGSRTDLIGKEFLTGSVADWAAPTTHIRFSDDPALKAEYALHTLLGGLATLPHRMEWSLFVVPSIHNREMFTKQIVDNLSGIHTVSFAGKDTPPTRVKVEVPTVVPEGLGSYTHARRLNLLDPTQHAIAFDFGTSTVIPVVFSPGGRIIRHQPLEVGGCVDLLRDIATDAAVVSFIGTGKAGSVELTRQAVESGELKYTVHDRQGQRTFDLKPIYARYLKQWMTDRLRLAFKDIEEWRNSTPGLVAWGGGVEMPGVSQMLSKVNITAVPEGSWANAIGLQRMAEAKLQQRIK